MQLWRQVAERDSDCRYAQSPSTSVGKRVVVTIIESAERRRPYAVSSHRYRPPFSGHWFSAGLTTAAVCQLYFTGFKTLQCDWSSEPPLRTHHGRTELCVTEHILFKVSVPGPAIWNDCFRNQRFPLTYFKCDLAVSWNWVCTFWDEPANQPTNTSENNMWRDNYSRRQYMLSKPAKKQYRSFDQPIGRPSRLALSHILITVYAEAKCKRADSLMVQSFDLPTLVAPIRKSSMGVWHSDELHERPTNLTRPLLF